MKFKTKVTELTQNELSNLLSTMFTGNFWANADYKTSDDAKLVRKTLPNSCFEDRLAWLLINDHVIEIEDVEEETAYDLNFDMIKKGIGNYIDNNGDTHDGNLGYCDLEEADLILQYAIFDEIVYG